jgi:1-acyl-sn-glycerol-3-phosphate acyltransferase
MERRQLAGTYRAPTPGSVAFAIFGAIAAFLAVSLLLRKFYTLQAESKVISECGYTPPLPEQKHLHFLEKLCKFILAVQVGPLEVRGAEHLESVPYHPEKPAIFVSNHTSYADPAVVPLVIKRVARYMPAVGVMHFAGGMGAHVISRPMAAIPVQILPGQGGPAQEAAIAALTKGDTIVIFPEGWAYQDGAPGPFKRGAARIALGATKQLGQPIPLIPIFIKYNRYAPNWITRLGPPWEYFLLALGSWYYRRGAIATVGTPFMSTELPDDVDAATAFIRTRVLSLCPGPAGESPCSR